MAIHVRCRCGKSLSHVFPAACQCEQPEILMYHCKVNEFFPNLPSLLGGEFGGFETGKPLGRANCTDPALKQMPPKPLGNAILGHVCGRRLFSSHTFLTFPYYPTRQTYLPAYGRGIQCVSLILSLAFNYYLQAILNTNQC